MINDVEEVSTRSQGLSLGGLCQQGLCDMSLLETPWVFEIYYLEQNVSQ